MCSEPRSCLLVSRRLRRARGVSSPPSLRALRCPRRGRGAVQGGSWPPQYTWLAALSHLLFSSPAVRVKHLIAAPDAASRACAQTPTAMADEEAPVLLQEEQTEALEPPAEDAPANGVKRAREEDCEAEEEPQAKKAAPAEEVGSPHAWAGAGRAPGGRGGGRGGAPPTAGTWRACGRPALLAGRPDQPAAFVCAPGRPCAGRWRRPSWHRSRW